MGIGSKLDPNQIARAEHDDESQSKRVKIIDTAISIELDAEDGDSVQTQSRTFNIEVESGEEYPADQISKMRIYCKTLQAGSYSEIPVQVSPLDEGDFWVNSGVSITPSPSLNGIKVSSEGSIMAKRMRIVTASPVELVIVAKG